MHECMLCINVCVCAKSASVYEYICVCDHIFVIVNEFVFVYSQMCVCMPVCLYMCMIYNLSVGVVVCAIG